MFVITLRWFRDQSRGQEAADAMNAVQVQDGSWPQAILQCKDNDDAECKWWELIKKFDVNAMTYYDMCEVGNTLKKGAHHGTD